MRLVLLLTLLPLAACAGAGMTGNASTAGLTHQELVGRDMQAILEGMQNARSVAGTMRASPLSGESVAPPLRRMPGSSPY